MISGYLHPAYAESMREFGTPRELTRSKGWVLEREIPGSASMRDAMGCYPIFSCQDWLALRTDLEEKSTDWVTFCCVADPFGNYELDTLKGCFDNTIAFKERFVVESPCCFEKSVSQHHRYYARRALKNTSIHYCECPTDYLEDWTQLYSHLTQAHGLTGIKAFSADAFKKQFEVPGLVVFRAEMGGKIVAMHLWYLQNDLAYSHLAASNPQGYEVGASYALYWKALEMFRDTARLVDIGAGSGTTDSSTNGLTAFKKGWTSKTRPSLFCSRIFSPERYRGLVKKENLCTTQYFPAYRFGEFG